MKSIINQLSRIRLTFLNSMLLKTTIETQVLMDNKKDQIFLGIDFGSLNTKALLLDESFQIVGKTIIQKNQDLSERIASLIEFSFHNRKNKVFLALPYSVLSLLF